MTLAGGVVAGTPSTKAPLGCPLPTADFGTEMVTVDIAVLPIGLAMDIVLTAWTDEPISTGESIVAVAPVTAAGMGPSVATVVGVYAVSAGKKVKALTSRRKDTTRTLSFILSV